MPPFFLRHINFALLLTQSAQDFNHPVSSGRLSFRTRTPGVPLVFIIVVPQSGTHANELPSMQPTSQLLSSTSLSASSRAHGNSSSQGRRRQRGADTAPTTHSQATALTENGLVLQLLGAAATSQPSFCRKWVLSAVLRLFIRAAVVSEARTASFPTWREFSFCSQNNKSSHLRTWSILLML